MCLDTKLTDEEKKEWLDKRPDTITCYKLVNLGYDDSVKKQLCPKYYVNTKPFKRRNLLRKVTSKKSYKHVQTNAVWDRDSVLRSGGKPYTAYYHLYAFKPKRFKGKLIECKVPKKFITEVGRQWNRTTVVTRCFEIVGEDRYLKD